MNRGGSSGGGQSSLGYLFGSGHSNPAETPPKPAPVIPSHQDQQSQSLPSPKSPKEGKVSNNYHRADGQNAGNFITTRPSTKVQSVPGGGSSLGYLFGDKK